MIDWIPLLFSGCLVTEAVNVSICRRSWWIVGKSERGSAV